MENKVVLITGGTRGIGKSLVKEYLQAGYQVATFSTNKAHVSNLIKECHAGKNLFCARVDLNNQADCLSFAQTVMSKFGKIDCFYFNAGIYEDASFLKMTLTTWQSVLETNLLSAFSLTQFVFQQMTKQAGAKRIYLLTSLAGIEGTYGQANYSASKAGLIGLTKTLALEGKKHQIKVNAISPAAVTDMTRPIIEKVKLNCTATGTEFPAYWKIGTSDELAKTLYQLDQGMLETGRVFSVNGEKVRMYEEPSSREYSV